VVFQPPAARDLGTLAKKSRTPKKISSCKIIGDQHNKKRRGKEKKKTE
jgi:hypothetical protein